MTTINPLRAGLLIFGFLTIAGLFFFRFKPGNYKVSVKESLSKEFLETGISPSEFRQYYQDKETDILLLDIRSLAQYEKAHLEGANSYPEAELLNKGHLRKFKKQDVYIYSDKEAHAHRAAMLLSMLGVKAKAINSSFENIQKVVGGKSTPEEGLSSHEKIQFDYAKHFKAFKEDKPVEVKVTVIKPRAGGC